MSEITIKRTLPAEFLGDILVTAFDGNYGWSWSWFEPVGGDWLKVDKTPRGGPQENDFHTIWKSCQVRLQEEYHTGDKTFDDRRGFVVNHDVIILGIQRILDDDYVGVLKPANAREIAQVLDAYGLKTPKEGEVFGRKFINKGGKFFADIYVETGETARGYQSDLASIITDPDAGDIDAPFADAIVQVGVFGKAIFG